MTTDEQSHVRGDVDLSWIPEHHLSVVATLAHANSLTEDISRLLSSIGESDGGFVSLERRTEGGVQHLVVDELFPLPRKLPLLVSDVLAALRSAIEHAIYAEVVQLNDGALAGNQVRTVEMPACKSAASFEDWVRHKVRRTVVGLQSGATLLQRIEKLQPYHLDDPQEHPLKRLVDLSNASKHRAPALTSVFIPVVMAEDEYPQAFSDLPRRQEKPLEVGDILFTTPVGGLREVKTFSMIGINRPGSNSWPVLLRELGELTEWTRNTAIPILLTGSIDVTTPIPASYDYAAGHRDEREAFENGSWMTAEQRSQLHAKALSVRMDLPGLVRKVDPSLSEAHIEQWVTTLNDSEVLRRFGMLNLCEVQDSPGRSWAALEAIAMRVRRFLREHED